MSTDTLLHFAIIALLLWIIWRLRMTSDKVTALIAAESAEAAAINDALSTTDETIAELNDLVAKLSAANTADDGDAIDSLTAEITAKTKVITNSTANAKAAVAAITAPPAAPATSDTLPPSSDTPQPSSDTPEGDAPVS